MVKIFGSAAAPPPVTQSQGGAANVSSAKSSAEFAAEKKRKAEALALKKEAAHGDGTADKKPTLCYKCWEAGHMAKDCPNQRRKKPKTLS